MSTLQLPDGGTLHYQVVGERGPWLVLLNGAMGSTAAWAEVAPLLARRHRVLLVDFRDQGRSSHRVAGYAAADQVDDLVALFDELRIERLDVVGVSYGGHVALCLARARPDRLRRLVVAAITARPPARLQAVGEAWDAVARGGDARAFMATVAPLAYSHRFYQRYADSVRRRQELLAAAITPAWLDAFARISASARSFDHGEALPGITAPTLLVCGTDDQLTPAAEVFAMAEQLPDATCLALPGVGHGLFVEDPRAFATAILGFTSVVDAESQG